MSNSNQYKNKASVRFVADGELKDFHFNFIIFSVEDVEIYLNSTLQTEGFTINKSTNSSGGNVVFTTPPAKDTIVTIARNLEVKRTTNFSESKAFRANMLNHEFDYQVACLEQIADSQNRNMTLPVYAETGVTTTLPSPQPGKAILWNAEGNALINSQIDVETLDTGIIRITESAAQAEQAATSAIAASEEAKAAVESKANKDLTNVSAWDLRTKVGTRYFDSGEIGVWNGTVYNNAHGIKIPINVYEVISRVSLICFRESNGYQAGEEVCVWGISGPTGIVEVCCPVHLHVNLNEYRFVTTNGIYVINRWNKNYEKINNDNYRFRIRIHY